MANRTNKKIITFSDRQLDMMDLISEYTGLEKVTDIVRMGIQELYDKYYKTYKTGQGGRSTPKTEEQMIMEATAKSKAKIIGEKAEEEARLQPKINICLNELKGDIEETISGAKICRFTQYNAFFPEKDSDQRLPINQVGMYLTETSLFIPSKEVVFKNRKDVKDKFND